MTDCAGRRSLPGPARPSTCPSSHPLARSNSATRRFHRFLPIFLCPCPCAWPSVSWRLGVVVLMYVTVLLDTGSDRTSSGLCRQIHSYHSTWPNLLMEASSWKRHRQWDRVAPAIQCPFLLRIGRSAFIIYPTSLTNARLPRYTDRPS